ncbi:MAG: lytic transglycosylase domain-containing protein [Sulfuricurvum sp.]|nr:lytic transglycosylase domain-containing protein [Sulfuricurvum sp.]MDP3021762.1 lytic transglycosylase domain-containing protein [Sulfuricurvum sp.]MDP3120138.1 lytic transglycosylase domain-containing protein [Sulfuricurvum sp.]
MRWLLLMIAFTFDAYPFAFKPNDEKKITVLKHFDIPASFLNDSYLNDMYIAQKRYCTENGFANSSENANILIPMLTSLISQSDLPSEFLFVALAESSLDTLSTSSQGASGIWQFMASTGQLHGLKITSYVDERRDHLKSTRAAIAYLSQLHRQFGKWYLAIIAYNCGDGRLSKAIRKAGTDDLSVLASPNKKYIPLESRHYIRKIIALALLASDQVFLEQIQYDHLIGVASENPIATVYLPEGEDINRIAAVLEMPKKKLLLLNTHLKRGITPPSKDMYPVYIPEDKLELFRQTYRTKELKGYFVMHRTKAGENLDTVSKKYDVSSGAIRIENMMGDRDELTLNHNIKIPINRGFIRHASLDKAKSGEIKISVAKLYNSTIEQLKVKNLFIQPKVKDGEEIKVGD